MEDNGARADTLLSGDIEPGKFDRRKLCMANNGGIRTPPRGLAILALVGPGFVWCSEMIGSGEVILSTRAGAILGTNIMWAVTLVILLKCWIGIGGARYTVCTGEGMVDMFDRVPGPRHWVVWFVLVAQLLFATVAMGALATSAGAFLNNMIPALPEKYGGWIISVVVLSIVWSGQFNVLKMVMSVFVALMILGILYVSFTLFPGWSEFLEGFLFKMPEVPNWAVATAKASPSGWREMLPLMGWAAGGFASQVWYTYWVIGAGYGVAAGRGYGKPADTEYLKNLDGENAQKVRGWCNVVATDAAFAMVITVILTLSFVIAGSVTLGSRQIAPEGKDVAITLSNIFSSVVPSQWGQLGGFIFMLTGTVALMSTLTGQMAGWPRLLADAFRICVPKFTQKFSWKVQFRTFLVLFFTTNIIIVHTLGLKPVLMVRLGGMLEGLLLTPLQALWVAVGLFVVMPRLLSKEAYAVLKPGRFFGLVLILAFLLLGYFCVTQMPGALQEIWQILVGPQPA